MLRVLRWMLFWGSLGTLACSATPSADSPAVACDGDSPGDGYVCMKACGAAGYAWHSPEVVKARKEYGCPGAR